MTYARHNRLAQFWIIILMGITLVVSLAPKAFAQTTFVEVTPPNDDLFNTSPDEDFWLNAAAPADVDGDGDLDLAVIGFYVVYHVSAVDRLVIFINDGPDLDGNWQFSRQEVPLNGIYAGASDLAWGDYDNDGDPDLAVGSEGFTAIFRNDAGTLVETPIVLPGYYEDSYYTGAYDLRSLTWADIDNDADLDLLIPSVFDFTTYEYQTKLMRNDGVQSNGEWAFSEVEFALDPTNHAQSAWADDDQDGDLDLFLMNIDQYDGTGFIRRFENQPTGMPGTDLIGIQVEYGLADWGDYDADADMDILVAGSIQETDGTYSTVLRIYENQNGIFSENTLMEANYVDWYDLHAATWADYDSDGDVDILLTGNYLGSSNFEGKSDIFENVGGVFSPLNLNLPAPVDSVGRGGAFIWFDIDNDGDLDYFVGGAYFVPNGNGLVESQMHLYRNEASNFNAPPNPPAWLNETVSGSDVSLAWGPALDDSTPADAMTYDLQLRSNGQPVTAYRHLPEPGNISAVLNWELKNLPEGNYTWSVRGVDSAFNASDTLTGTFAIAPPSVTPEGTKLNDGVLIAGQLSDLSASDNQYMRLNPSPTKNLLKQKIHLIIQSTSPTNSPAEFKFRLESLMSGGPSGDVLQSIELMNYDTGVLEIVDLRPVSNSDESVSVTLTGDLSRFVQPLTNEITAEVTWKSESFAGKMFSWSVSVDEAVWVIGN